MFLLRRHERCVLLLLIHLIVDHQLSSQHLISVKVKGSICQQQKKLSILFLVEQELFKILHRIRSGLLLQMMVVMVLLLYILVVMLASMDQAGWTIQELILLILPLQHHTIDALRVLDDHYRVLVGSMFL